jgi:hypothetical protein
MCLAVLAGCSTGAEDGEIAKTVSHGDPVLATTRVENGVTVHEHAQDAFRKAPQWTVEATPTTTIGGSDGDPQFDLTYARYVIPLSDGRVMTFAQVGNKVIVFRKDGKGVRTIGRTGQGPGDWMAFGDPVLLDRDTILVLDFANNRLNWVTADGGIVRTAPYLVPRGVRRMSSISGFLPTGELVMHSAASWGGHQLDSLQRSIAVVMAANLDNGETRTLTQVPDIQGAPVETRYRGRIRNDWQPLRLGGYARIAGWDSVIATATASSSTVDLRDPTGNVGAQLRLGLPRRPVTQAMRDAQIAIELERMEGPRSEGMVDPGESRRLASESPFSDSLAYFEALLRGSDGTLWVVDAIAPGDTSWTATAVRKDGAIVGRLFVRGNSRPISFGNGTVIVRTQDENDVVSFKVHRVVPGETRIDTDRPK